VTRRASGLKKPEPLIPISFSSGKSEKKRKSRRETNPSSNLNKKPS